MSSSSSSYNSPCAACKFLRRKCIPGCVFSPYFPPEDPQKFFNVHKIFGASNVAKLLNDVLPHQREDAVSSLAYEAEARVRDPVYGCVGVISSLQHQVDRIQKDLDTANVELMRYASGYDHRMPHFSSSVFQQTQRSSMDHNFSSARTGGFYHNQPPSNSNFPYNNYQQQQVVNYQQRDHQWNWRNLNSNSHMNMRGGSNGGRGGGN